MLSLITDRSLQDIEELKYFMSQKWDSLTEAQKTKYLGGLKGAYNYTDLNRVGNAIVYLHGVLSDYGYNLDFDISDVKTDWSVSDIPTAAEMRDYLHYISAIRDTLSVIVSPDYPSTISNLNYKQANALEKILLDAEHILSVFSFVWYHAGASFSICGNQGGLIS